MAAAAETELKNLFSSYILRSSEVILKFSFMEKKKVKNLYKMIWKDLLMQL